MLLEKMPTHFRDFLFSQPDGENVEIRTGMLENGEIVFHASDLCRLLGLGNPSNAIEFHLDDDEAYKLEVGRVYPEWFVTKSGLYGLMLGSNKPQAKMFKRWLRKEVLVKLDASGGYIMPTATSEQLEVLKLEISEKENKIKALAGENKRVTRINKECSELDAKLAFIVQAIVDGVCEQMSQFDLSLMSSKKYRKYKVYFDALHELQEILEDIMPYNLLAHKSELTETLTNENINRLFDTVALKKHDVTWDVNFKDWHDANLSEK